MPMIIRQIRHRLLYVMLNVVVNLAPPAQHRAFVGSGSARQLCRHIARTGARRVLVVTDKPLRELGVVDRAIAGLLDAGLDVAIYDGVLPDPTFDQVAMGVEALRAHGGEVILAVGGGSSMDAAKVIAASATSDEPPRSWVGFGKVRHRALTLYAIPTTSGTGSEATQGAVISDPVTHQKGVISGSWLLPCAVALDPELLLGLPPHITAATGVDALTHAVEAYIGTWERGNRLEDARIAVKLVFDNLGPACRDGGDLEAREGMALAAYHGGLAVNQVNVGNVHAIAHQLGGRYGIPHGLANALVLPHVLEFCREEAEQRLAELALLVGVGEEGEDPGYLAGRFIQAVRDLRTEVGLPDRSELIRREDYDDLIGLAIREADTYPAPKLLDRDSVLNILAKITA